FKRVHPQRQMCVPRKLLGDIHQTVLAVEASWGIHHQVELYAAVVLQDNDRILRVAIDYAKAKAGIEIDRALLVHDSKANVMNASDLHVCKHKGIRERLPAIVVRFPGRKPGARLLQPLQRRSLAWLADTSEASSSGWLLARAECIWPERLEFYVGTTCSRKQL